MVEGQSRSEGKGGRSQKPARHPLRDLGLCPVGPSSLLCWDLTGHRQLALCSLPACAFSLLLLMLLSRFSRVQLCATPDGSPPGSAIPGILQARTLEWGAVAFSICVHEFTPISSSIRSIRERPAITTQEPRQPEGARAEPPCALVPDSESVSGGQSELRGSSAQTHSCHFLP